MMLWCNLLPVRPGTPGRTPSLYNKCTVHFYVHYTTHRTVGFTSHPKDAVIMVKETSLGIETRTNTLLITNNRA